MSNSFLLKLSILGTVLMLYGGLNHLRKHPESREFILKRLPEKYHAKFLDIVSPKNNGMNVEVAKNDLKKIRGVDEKCFSDNGADCNRFAAKPVLAEKFKDMANGDNALGKAAKQLIKIENSKFEEFDKIDKVTE